MAVTKGQVERLVAMNGKTWHPNAGCLYGPTLLTFICSPFLFCNGYIDNELGVLQGDSSFV